AQPSSPYVIVRYISPSVSLSLSRDGVSYIISRRRISRVPLQLGTGAVSGQSLHPPHPRHFLKRRRLILKGKSQSAVDVKLRLVSYTSTTSDSTVVPYRRTCSTTQYCSTDAHRLLSTLYKLDYTRVFSRTHAW
ncbi:unnamed protein product, partial [Sphacelaria rigidula]